MYVKCTLSNEDNANVLPVCSPACFALVLPSAFCCFTASIDVYGTHSNVHLCCFHTGKSAVTHATPKVSSVPTRHHRLILCPHLPSCLNLPSFRLWPFFCYRCLCGPFLSFLYHLWCWGEEVISGISVFVLIVIQKLFCLADLLILCEYNQYRCERLWSRHTLNVWLRFAFLFSEHRDYLNVTIIEPVWFSIHFYIKHIHWRIMGYHGWFDGDDAIILQWCSTKVPSAGVTVSPCRATVSKIVPCFVLITSQIFFPLKWVKCSIFHKWVHDLVKFY